MYFWNVKALVNDLRDDKITEHEKFKYFFLIVVVNSFLYISPAHHLLPNYLLYSNLVQAVLTGLGLYSCYKANYQGDNKDFIGRYICLFVPTTIRIMLLTIFLMVPIMLVTRPSTLERDIFTLLCLFITTLIQYLYVRSCIIDISSTIINKSIQDNI